MTDDSILLVFTIIIIALPIVFYIGRGFYLRYNKINIRINLLEKQIKILEASHQILDATNKTIYTITTQNDRIIEAIENNANMVERFMINKGASE